MQSRPLQQHHGSCVPEEHQYGEVAHIQPTQPTFHLELTIFVLRIFEMFQLSPCWRTMWCTGWTLRWPGKPASFTSLVGDLQLWINQLDDPANHKRVKSDHWKYGRVELTRDACTCLAFLRTSFSPHSLHVSLATTTRIWQISSFKCNS